MDLQESDSNLYKWVAILGATLCYVSMIGFNQQFSRHSDLMERFVEHHLDGGAEKNPAAIEGFSALLALSKSNSRTSCFTLAFCAVAGAAVAVVSIYLWYHRIQVHVDKNIRDQSARLEDKVHSTT